MDEFKKNILEQQKINEEIWLREFERNGNSTKSVWEKEVKVFFNKKNGTKKL